jgi:hypothetical protein
MKQTVSLSSNSSFRPITVFELRSSDPSTPFGGPRTCAFATMKVTSTVLWIAYTLAGFTGAGFCST